MHKVFTPPSDTYTPYTHNATTTNQLRLSLTMLTQDLSTSSFAPSPGGNFWRISRVNERMNVCDYVHISLLHNMYLHRFCAVAYVKWRALTRTDSAHALKPHLSAQSHPNCASTRSTYLVDPNYEARVRARAALIHFCLAHFAHLGGKHMATACSSVSDVRCC